MRYVIPPPVSSGSSQHGQENPSSLRMSELLTLTKADLISSFLLLPGPQDHQSTGKLRALPSILKLDNVWLIDEVTLLLYLSCVSDLQLFDKHNGLN